MRVYALVGRFGDDGGRYLQSQRKQMMARAWQMSKAGEMVQVWRVMQDGTLLKYDGDATRRASDYIVKAHAALRLLREDV